MATEIGKAYLQIVPTTTGFKGQLESELSIPGDRLGSNIGKSFMGSLVKTVAGTAALKAAVSGLKTVISDYADFEQLTGGVETLFKDSSDLVMEYANNAYKTSGLSANAYMETVTSFSASLLQSLDGDTKKAASAADLAITDMADNANKMGSSMESIQNAYQGFAKQNYTMLDNLKLGYGGTKEEMQRLLEDATKLSHVQYDISSLNDVYEAIHVVQTEMGITGTTALEASETISGSANAMKAAWQNLLTGMADENADFDTLVRNFTDSLVTYADNIMPRIGTALEGVGELLQSFSETLFPKIIDYVADHLPDIVTSGVDIAASLAKGILKAVPEVVKAIPPMIKALCEAIVEAMPTLYEAGKDMIKGLFDGINSMGDWLADKLVEFFTGSAKSASSSFSGTRSSGTFSSGGSFGGTVNNFKVDDIRTYQQIEQRAVNQQRTTRMGFVGG